MIGVETQPQVVILWGFKDQLIMYMLVIGDLVLVEERESLIKIEICKISNFITPPGVYF